MLFRSQQYAKNLFLTNEQTFSRKIEELLYAARLEMQYSKKDILEGYLNTIYFGEDKLPEYWDKSEEEILEHTFQVVKKYFKELPDSYIGGHVVKAPMANFTMQNGCPTAIKEMRDKHYRDVEGLFFSGDYIYF